MRARHAPDAILDQHVGAQQEEEQHSLEHLRDRRRQVEILLRLLATDETTVTFAYKDYADGSRTKTMTLATAEFVRRFCLHVLPERFVKIRHYGLLGNRHKQTRLARARELLGVASPPAEATMY